MKLIEEIIDVLTREHPNIENALTKAKVLLYRLGEEPLALWVNAELTGYSDNLEVPAYRIIPTRVLVSATDGYTVRWNNVPVPLGHLKSDMYDMLTRTEVGHSVAVLQHFLDGEGEFLSKPLPAEFCPLLAKGLEKGISIETAHVEIGKSQIVGILAQIKSRLLDFVLQLSAQLPADISDTEVKAKSKEIDAANIFQNAIFGPNATIIVGNSNTQTATQHNVSVGDFESLATFLRSKNVTEPDIATLKRAIADDCDHVDASSQQFGPNVKLWMKSMLGKAVEASWQVEVGVASSLLATALNYYYGWF